MDEIKSTQTIPMFSILENEEVDTEKLDEYEKERAQYEAEKEKKQHFDYLKSCNIEPEFFNYELKDFIPRSPSQEKAKKAVETMINNKSGKIVLLGSNGIGKTMLASIAAKTLGGKIFTMYEISTMIRQSYTIKAEKSELEIVNELASIPFLAIDELGRTKGSDTEQNWLSYILDKRHTRNLPFMLLSNSHLKKDCPDGGCPRCFQNFMDNDILSRLRQNTVVVVVSADDIRSKNHTSEFWEDK